MTNDTKQKPEQINERTEYSEDDLNPIKIVTTSHTAVDAMGVSGLKKALQSDTVLMLREGHGNTYYAMITPICFEYLLLVADALKDEREFTIATQCLEGIG